MGVQGGPGAQWAPSRTDRAGRRDLAPLKILLKIKNEIPLPRLRGWIYLQGMGAGGGERAPVALCREPTEPAGETRGWACIKLPQAGETREWGGWRRGPIQSLYKGHSWARARALARAGTRPGLLPHLNDLQLHPVAVGVGEEAGVHREPAVQGRGLYGLGAPL